jgi:hypothetical protein
VSALGFLTAVWCWVLVGGACYIASVWEHCFVSSGGCLPPALPPSLTNYPALLPSSLTSLSPACPCSGGIQLAWPQYGVGPLPTNGFLQHLHWSVVDTAWRQPDMEAVAAQQAAEGPEGSGSVDLASMVDWRPTISLYADTGEQTAGRRAAPWHSCPRIPAQQGRLFCACQPVGVSSHSPNMLQSATSSVLIQVAHTIVFAHLPACPALQMRSGPRSGLTSLRRFTASL